MHIPNRFGAFAFALVLALPVAGARAQNPAELTALQGLSPVTALGNTPAGKAALAANHATTGAIQKGTAKQPLLLAFPAQQQLALRDAFITRGNLDQLADGLGSKLDAAYLAAATYSSPDGGMTSRFTNVSPAMAKLVAYTLATSGADADAGKYFFANATRNGTTPVSDAAKAILTGLHGITDPFGVAYGLPAGSPGADKFGNSRPFQTVPNLLIYAGVNYFGVPADNVMYLRGPMQNLVDSPSYPSGHTTYGYSGSMLLAVLVPERYEQMVVRGAEYGNNRIIIGAHYVMDVLGGRTLALHDLAHLLANAQGYVGVERKGETVADFPKLVAEARADLTRALEAGCGATVVVCAGQDEGRFADAARNAKFYAATQTYAMPVVFPKVAAAPEDVAKLAPEAGYLLTVAFPRLSLAQANAILTETEGPGGGFLDDGSAFGVYSRLDLARAARRAAAMP